MLEFRCGTGRCDFVDGLGTPHGGFEGPALLAGSGAGSLFHRFESVVPDPFLRAFRKEPFLSEAVIGGRSALDFLAGGDFVMASFFEGGLSEPLMDEAELIGFLDRFWLATFSIPFGARIDELPTTFAFPKSTDPEVLLRVLGFTGESFLGSSGPSSVIRDELGDTMNPEGSSAVARGASFISSSLSTASSAS